MELRKMSIDYERRRMQLQVYYGNLLYSVLYSFPIAISRDFVSDYHITSLLHSFSYCCLSECHWCCVEQVKNAERVRLEQIPLPDAPSTQAGKWCIVNCYKAHAATVEALHDGDAHLFVRSFVCLSHRQYDTNFLDCILTGFSIGKNVVNFTGGHFERRAAIERGIHHITTTSLFTHGSKQVPACLCNIV